jgi:hypothetical protein
VLDGNKVREAITYKLCKSTQKGKCEGVDAAGNEGGMLWRREE